MTRTPCTSMYSAVLLSFLLAEVVGSPTQPARNIQDPLKKMQPVGATEGDLLSQEEPDGVTIVKGNYVGSGKKVSRRSYAPVFKPQDHGFLRQVPVAPHFPRYFAKHIPCRNETSGCRVMLPAEEADYYSPLQNTSKFFLCLATVVCRDECILKCTAPVENSVPEKPLATAEKENENLVKFEKNVTSQVVALDVKVAKLLEEFDSQKNKLVEIGHQLNHFNDTLQETLRAATASTLESVDSKAREVKAFLNEKEESMTATLSSVLSTVAINPKTHRWTLTGYAQYKAKAIERGLYWEMSGNVYIQHYLISWGIDMRAEDGHLNLYLLFQLHKGRNDDVLDWPFSNTLKLCLIHQETQQERCASHKPNLKEESVKCFVKPLKDSNERVRLLGAKFKARDIENNGYTKEDKLFAKLEILA